MSINKTGFSQRRGPRPSITGGTTAGSFTTAFGPISSARGSVLSARVSLVLSVVNGNVRDSQRGSLAASARSLQSRAHQPDEPRTGERLFQYRDDAEFSGTLDADGIEPSADQDCRNKNRLALQCHQNLEATHPGHLLIDDQASHLAMPRIGQQRCARGVGYCLEAIGFEQRNQGIAHPSIVVDDMDAPAAPLSSIAFAPCVLARHGDTGRTSGTHLRLVTGIFSTRSAQASPIASSAPRSRSSIRCGLGIAIAPARLKADITRHTVSIVSPR